MRKLIGAVAALIAVTVPGVAAAGPAATNPAGNVVVLSVAVTPPVASGGAVGLTADAFAGNRINGDTSFSATSIGLLLSKGFKYNGTQFPACASVNAAPVCTSKAQIGSGTAEAQLAGSNGAPPSFATVPVRAYNGNLVGGKPSIVVNAISAGKVLASLQLVAGPGHGPYGLEFKTATTTTPSPLEIAGLDVTLPARTLTRKHKGKTVKVALLQAPTTCTGSWAFALTDTYPSGPPLTATDTQPCVTS